MAGPFGGDAIDFGSTWLAYQGVGGKNIGSSVELGVQNDLQIDDSKRSNLATIVTVSNGAGNAAFAALNGGGKIVDPVHVGAGGVGLYLGKV